MPTTPGRRRLNNTIRRLDLRKANRNQHIPALMGTPLNGEEVVEVPNRPNFVYCRLRDNQSELIQAFNRSVAPVYNLPVLIRRDEFDPSRYEVVDIDRGRYDNWGGSSFVPKHAGQHMFNPDAPGGDIVWAYDRQLMPLLVHPSGTAGACNVVIEPDVYYQDGQWKYGGGTGTGDLCALKPTDGTAKMVLVYLDSNSVPQFAVGSSFPSTNTGTVQVLPYVPTLPSTSALPLAWIRLVSGTSRILWDNIYDARPWMVGDGVLSTGTSKHIIQDEGTIRPNRPYLNFVGNIVTVTDDPSNNATKVTITGSSSGHIIQDEGTPVTDRPNLNFIGTNVFVTDDGGSNRTNVTVSGSVSQGFASLAEAQQGDIPHKMISPFTLPVWVRNGAMIRRDGTGAQGNARGDGAVDLQRDRYAPEQVASGPYASIGGGIGNRNNSEVSAIGGGETNTILGSGDWMTIAGGFGNLISGSASGAAIVGGQNNSIGGSASNASIIGGSTNNATATQTVVSGNNAHAFLPYMEARAVGQTGSGRQQRIQLVWSRSTTNATPTELMIAAVNRAVMQNYSTWLFEIWVVGHNTTTQGEGAGYKFTGLINRQATAASTALIGSVTKVEVAESVAAWDANVDADTTNGSLRIMVTGEAGETIIWFAHAMIAQSQ